MVDCIANLPSGSKIMNMNFDYYPRNEMELDYFRSPSKLFQYIENGDETMAISQLTNAPEEARKWVVKKSEHDESIMWRRLPIHEACIRNPSEELIDALIQAYATGVKEPDAANRLPLHHACFHGASHSVIMKLVRSYPESIDIQDSWGKVPLSLTESSTSPNKVMIQDILCKGQGFYFRKVVEDKWTEIMTTEKVKMEENFKTMKKNYARKILSLERSASEAQHEFEEREKQYLQHISEIQLEHDELKKKYNKMCSDHERYKKEMAEENEKYSKTLTELQGLVLECRKTSGRDVLELKQKESDVHPILSKSYEDDKINSELSSPLSKKVEELSKEKSDMQKEITDLKYELKQVENMKRKNTILESSLFAIDSNHDAIISAVENSKNELSKMERNQSNALQLAREAHNQMLTLREDFASAVAQMP